jgi:hypothetical protein
MFPDHLIRFIRVSAGSRGVDTQYRRFPLDEKLEDIFQILWRTGRTPPGYRLLYDDPVNRL